MSLIANRIYETPEPTLGLIIGTYSSAPYVHLGLESRARNYPGLPVLINDDCSPSEDELQSLCAKYGAEYHRNSQRYHHSIGDLTVFQRGFEWAQNNNIDILVKFSRRFIPLFNWVPDFQDLAWRSQYATFSNIGRVGGFGFRTECIAMHVKSWVESGAVDMLSAQISTGKVDLVEAFMHRLARKVHATSCAANREYEILYPKAQGFASYCNWPLMGENRQARVPGILWRVSCRPVEYCRAAIQYGITEYPLSAYSNVPGAKDPFVGPRRLRQERKHSDSAVEKVS